MEGQSWLPFCTSVPDRSCSVSRTLSSEMGLLFPHAGILTHIKLKVHKKEDHPDARGLNIVVPYSASATQKLLQQIADSAKNEDLPGDYDFCLTVISNAPRPEQPLEDDDVSGPAPRAMMRRAAVEGDSKEEGEVDISSALRKYGYSEKDIQEFEKVGWSQVGAFLQVTQLLRSYVG